MGEYSRNTETILLDVANGNKDCHCRKFRNYKPAAPSVKECFTDYSLEDKVEALKNVLMHNGKHLEEPQRITNMCNIKETIGVKECLQPRKETPFQTIISELKNTVVNSYWNKEVGKTRYQIPNLPIGMNPLEMTFGKKLESGETMAMLLKQKAIETDISEQRVIEMYKKSHNSYLPAEQIKRHYAKPFDENVCYGKVSNTNIEGVKVKRLLRWINTDPDTIVNINLAEFMERSYAHIGETKNLKNAHLYMNMTHGKVIKKPGMSEKLSIVSDCLINNEVTMQQKCLQYINTLRQKFKHRDPEISFSDIYEDLLCFDKDYTNILPKDKVLSILTKHKIYINETLLTPLLNLLQIYKDQNVKYKELLNLLNWKYDFPTLPKIEKIPLECQSYTTTYNTTIGNVDKIDTTCIPIAGISYEDPDKTTAYDLILPNTFTRYGLSNSDLSKLRNKEEIRSIFENIGIQFPNDSFNSLWEEGSKRSGSNNVSVETFRNLLNQYDNLINDTSN
ncbi:EF-hand domain-containing family member B [Anthophora quadrimaculata]